MIAGSDTAARMEGSTADREIVTRRVYDASRERVFDAWTDPRALAEWWGPRGFTTTTSEMDVRPGGVWRFVMRGPDGTDYKNRVEYVEVVRPERLVYRHSGEDETADIAFHVTVTFVSRADGTEVTLRSVFPTAEQRDEVAEKAGAVEGARQTLERLAEYLAPR